MGQNLQETIQAWQDYLHQKDWHKLIEGVTPGQTGCGPVYELPNYLERSGESFAIADMREVKVAEPHYYPVPSIEIYLVLQGRALVVVGGEEHCTGPGDAVIIPSDNAHYTIPGNYFVIAAIKLPEFQPEHYITIPTDQNDDYHRFDAVQFKSLVK